MEVMEVIILQTLWGVTGKGQATNFLTLFKSSEVSALIERARSARLSADWDGLDIGVKWEGGWEVARYGCSGEHVGRFTHVPPSRICSVLGG